MDYDSAKSTQGAGFSFEIPVPLPELGHRFVLPFNVEGHSAIVIVVQVPRDEPIGGVTFQGPGLRDHGRDRFGVFSRSTVEIRLLGGPAAVTGLGLVGPLAVFATQDGGAAGILGPTEVGREFCVRVVNDLIDAYARTHGTYWLAQVTPDDIMSLQVMDWGDPGSPSVIGMMLGTGSTHTMRFGRADGYSATDPQKLLAELTRVPSLAEDLLLSSRRDLTTRRHRSALAHACLAFEVFVRSTLEANAARVPDERFRDKTLKPMCERKGCLPALIGGVSLRSDTHGVRRQDYERVAALRDALLHHGHPVYSLGEETIQVIAEEAVREHIDLIVRLAHWIGECVVAHGGVSVRFE